MNASNRNRISSQTTESSMIGGIAVELVDRSSALGGFSRACTKALPTMEEAVVAAAGFATGVRVVKQMSDGRWQGWVQRRNAGRVRPRGAEDTMGLKIDVVGNRLLVAIR